MALLITGHPRSGTQLLQKVVNSHPEVALTNEFGCFRALGTPPTLYGLGIMGRCWARRKLPILAGAGRRQRLLRSYAFEARFLARLYQQRPPLVQAADVEALLQHLFPEASVVGDKFPDYVFSLHQFAGLADLSTVVIYRDCRDVVASYLERLRGGWHRMPVFSAFDTPQKIAARWARAIAQMQRCQSGVLTVCYEDFVRAPRPTLERLGQQLGLAPEGFSVATIRASSVGRHEERLSQEELTAIWQTAGTTMKALGYT